MIVGKKKEREEVPYKKVQGWVEEEHRVSSKSVASTCRKVQFFYYHDEWISSTSEQNESRGRRKERREGLPGHY